jgi:hypothetical protein
MTPQGLSYKAFNFPSHPDHKYIWFRGGDLGMDVDANVKLCIQHFLFLGLSPTLLGNLYKKM